MIRNLLRFTLLAVVAAAITASSTTAAKAHGGLFFRGYWGAPYSYGHYGGYGYGGYRYASYGYGGYGYGGHGCCDYGVTAAYRGCCAPLFRRRCCTPSPCYTPVYLNGCCYGDYGTEVYQYDSGVIQEPQPTEAAPDGGPTPAPIPLPSVDASILSTGRALLSVDVPEEARVFVNGVATATPGSHRTYASSGLSIGTEYTYQVRVEVERDGQIVSLDRTITLRAGEEHNEVFDFNASHVAAN